jgi:hypothetical protein
MLILCKTNQVRQGGYRWRLPLPLPWGWELRWQRLGCYILADLPHRQVAPPW